ncbi:flagellin [Clostridium beijerinckii]|uniref:Flagellin n=1 Tax=Clostridium beijerinckii TaxID=1520 RepID=A0A1S9NCP9_CLOBE|nr:flagellin [Clostridium beijerinckii]OOP75163.1 flagellin [Clostridium beijerinckii]
MIINHNLMANNAIRNMNINSNNASNSMQKLSSGLRINKAGDDAAGLAISEKMRGQIRGLDQASANSQDAISMIQTAEGALNETHSILQRMRELAVQSSTDTNTTEDRAKIQGETDQLAKEITRISNTTEFNTQNLLAGGLNDTFQIGANKGQNIGLSIKAMDAQSLGVAGMSADVSGVTSGMQGASFAGTKGSAIIDGNVITVTSSAVAGAAAGTTGAVGGLTFSTTGNTDALNGIKVHYVDGGDSVTAGNETASYDKDTKTLTLTGDFNNTDTTSTYSTAANLTTKANTALHAAGFTDAVAITGTAGTATADKVGTVASGSHGTVTISVQGTEAGHAAETVANVAANSTGIDLNGTKYGGLHLNFNDGTDLSATSTMAITISGSKAAVTNPDGTIYTEATTAAGIDVSSQVAANNAIKTIDTAINTVSQERSKLGAYQNRLEHTIANLGTSSENLTSSESRIRDVDMAKEMSTFSKNNILSQAAQAMLAQANQQPQQVLQLLR